MAPRSLATIVRIFVNEIRKFLRHAAIDDFSRISHLRDSFVGNEAADVNGVKSDSEEGSVIGEFVIVVTKLGHPWIASRGHSISCTNIHA